MWDMGVPHLLASVPSSHMTQFWPSSLIGGGHFRCDESPRSADSTKEQHIEVHNRSNGEDNILKLFIS